MIECHDHAQSIARQLGTVDGYAEQRLAQALAARCTRWLADWWRLRGILSRGARHWWRRRKLTEARAMRPQQQAQCLVALAATFEGDWPPRRPSSTGRARRQKWQRRVSIAADGIVAGEQR